MQDERQRIEGGGGVVRNHRVNGILAVSRSFGDLEHKVGGSGGEEATGRLRLDVRASL